MSKGYGRGIREPLKRFWLYIRHAFSRLAILRKFKDWIGLFQYFPTYIKSISGVWQQILWGETMLGAAITIISFVIGNVPLSVIFSVGVIVAGFFLWCAEYKKSIPKFAISSCIMQPTPMVDTGGQVVSYLTYIQLEPKCLSDARVTMCESLLIRIYKRNSESQWVVTGANEPVFLKWSTRDEKTIALEPKAETRLNVCNFDSKGTYLVPDAHFVHARAFNDLRIPGEFSFDIKVTGDDCAPIYVSLEVAFRNGLDKPICTLRQGLTMEEKQDNS